MKRPVNHRVPAPIGHNQHGVALFEVLICMALIALWLLASAGLQGGMLRMGKSSDSRQQAINLALDLAERMQANKTQALTASYASTIPSSSSDCAASACDSASLAVYDLVQWSAAVSSALPSASKAVTWTNSSSTYSISISWQEPRGRQTYATTGTTETATFTLTKILQ